MRCYNRDYIANCLSFANLIVLNKWGGGGGEGRGIITFSRDNLLLLPWKRGAYSRGGYMRKKSLFKTEGGGGWAI